jgi:hypothetical protein
MLLSDNEDGERGHEPRNIALDAEKGMEWVL